MMLSLGSHHERKSEGNTKSQERPYEPANASVVITVARLLGKKSDEDRPLAEAHMMNTVAPQDRKFLPKEEVLDYNPERERAKIEQTITEYEALRKKKLDERVGEYEERSDAVTSYLRSLEKGGKSSDMEKYFGKRMLAYLRGMEIRQQLMSGMRVQRPDGKVLKEAA